MRRTMEELTRCVGFRQRRAVRQAQADRETVARVLNSAEIIELR